MNIKRFNDFFVCSFNVHVAIITNKKDAKKGESFPFRVESKKIDWLLIKIQMIKKSSLKEYIKRY